MIQQKKLRNLIKWDEFTSYYYGYFLGDGGLTKGRPRLSIESCDVDELATVASMIDVPLVIPKTKNKIDAKIQYTSNIHYEFFVNLGIVPDKTHRGCLLKELPTGRNFFHFMRGLIDADGWVSISMGVTKPTYTLGIEGHRSYLKQIRKALDDLGYSFDWTPATRVNDNRQIHLHSKYEIIRFGRELYKDAHYYIKRKKFKFLLINQDCDLHRYRSRITLLNTILNKPESLIKYKDFSLDDLSVMFEVHPKVIKYMYDKFDLPYRGKGENQNLDLFLKCYNDNRDLVIGEIQEFGVIEVATKYQVKVSEVIDLIVKEDIIYSKEGEFRKNQNKVAAEFRNKMDNDCQYRMEINDLYKSLGITKLSEKLRLSVHVVKAALQKQGLYVQKRAPKSYYPKDKTFKERFGESFM